jgi:Tol biopolymer transport system component
MDGDLKTAMDAYQMIAADPAASRDLRARSLLRLAGCEEKIGQKARTVYERIVREFGDRPEAAQARNRLAALAARPSVPPTMTMRRIAFPASVPVDHEDTDGHRTFYRDDKGTLRFGDLAGHTSNVVLKGKSASLFGIASRDLSLYALGYLKSQSGRNMLAVVRNDGTGYRELPVAELADPSVQNWMPLSWSWDNHSLLIEVMGARETKVLIVSVADGSNRVLITKPKGGFIPKVVFSPDGRFVAYSQLASSGSEYFLIPIQGGDSRRVYQDAGSRLFDWTADGRYLIFSTFTGVPSSSQGLYLLPLTDGRAAGEPVLVRYGTFEMGTTRASGALIYESLPPGGIYALSVARLGADGPGPWRQLKRRGGNMPIPAWSSDGRSIAYVAKDYDAGRTGGALMLHNISTGAEHELYKGPGDLWCAWGAHPKIVCSESAGEKTELFAVPLEPGMPEHLYSFSRQARLAGRSVDDKAYYLYQFTSQGAAELVRWDVASHEITLLGNTVQLFGDLGPSQDDRWIVHKRQDNKIEIRPMSGGEFRVLASGSSFLGMGNVTPDGTWLLYPGVEGDKPGLFRVAVEGGSPQRLGDYPSKPGCCSLLSISPDGQSVAAVDGDPGKSDLWVLENFVPPPAKAR